MFKNSVPAFLAAALVCAAAMALEPISKPVLVVFDLKVHGDEAEIGRLVTSKILAKVSREGKFVVVEPMDVDPVVKTAQFFPDTASQPTDVLEFARRSFGADTALWGELQIHSDQSLSILIRAYCSRDGQPVALIDQQFAVPSRLHLSQTADQIAALVAERRGVSSPDTTLMDQNWLQRENLVPNGDFEIGEASPRFWQHLEQYMSVVREKGRGQVLRFDIPQAIAETYGLDFYSDFISVDETARYRFSADYRSEGPAVIFFIKGYALVPPPEGETAPQWREVYRYQRKAGAPKEWTTITFDFHPTVQGHRVEKIRVDLYAYYPPGPAFFDNIVIKKVFP